MSLRIVQVGMGAFGRSWASDVVPQVEGVELVGCVDVDPASLEKARAVTSLPANRYFLSLDEALQAVEADAVLVTAILAAHMPVAMAALSAGKHVLVEKPFAPTLAEARRAVDAAAECGLVLAVSQNYRFFPAVQAVERLVTHGELGRLDSVHVDFRRYDNQAPQGNHLHYRIPQPMLLDMAVHHFDLMRVVLGREPREIQCLAWNPPWSKFEDPAEAVATIRFEGEIVVSYRGSWLSAGAETPWGGHWRMEFEGGEVAWTSRSGGKQPESAESVTIRRLGQKPHRMPLPQLPHLDRAGSLSAFARAIQSGQEPEISGRDNLQTLALTLGSIESAASGSPVLL